MQQLFDNWFRNLSNPPSSKCWLFDQAPPTDRRFKKKTIHNNSCKNTKRELASGTCLLGTWYLHHFDLSKTGMAYPNSCPNIVCTLFRLVFSFSLAFCILPVGFLEHFIYITYFDTLRSIDLLPPPPKPMLTKECWAPPSCPRIKITEILVRSFQASRYYIDWIKRDWFLKVPKPASKSLFYRLHGVTPTDSFIKAMSLAINGESV